MGEPEAVDARDETSANSICCCPTGLVATPSSKCLPVDGGPENPPERVLHNGWTYIISLENSRMRVNQRASGTCTAEKGNHDWYEVSCVEKENWVPCYKGAC